MELKSGDLFLHKTFFVECKKNLRGYWRRKNGEDESAKMEKTKARNEVNVELFIVE